DSYTVVLTRQPTATVFITASAPPPSADELAAGSNSIALATSVAGLVADLSSIVLTFTPANWRIPQTVYVKAKSDSAVEGVRFATINHTARSTDTLSGTTALTAGASTLTDLLASFPATTLDGSGQVVANGLRDARVTITSGAGAGQTRLILSSTA